MIYNTPVKLSIIVPIFNVEKYLQECIDSIINQTLREIEIILVDDGSTDSSPLICDRYAQIDHRIKVIHKSNAGLVSARKSGLKEAQGEFVCYVDGDDCIDIEMCQNVYEKAINSNADMVLFGFQTMGQGTKQYVDNKIEGGLYSGERKNRLHKSMLCKKYFEWEILPSVWSKMFRRELLFDVQMKVPDDIKMGEDVACTYPAIEKSKRIYAMEKYFPYCYRYVESSMSRKWKLDYFDRIQILMEYLQNTFVNEKMKKQLDFYWVYLLNQGIIQLEKSDLPQEEKEIILGSICTGNSFLTKKTDTSLPIIVKIELFALRKKYWRIFTLIMHVIKNM